MIEVTLISYLQRILNMNEVYTEVPATMPKTFIVIDRTAHGKTETGLETAVIAFQSYGTTQYTAASLSAAVVDAVLSMPESETNIFQAELNSEYPWPDQANKRYRYQAIFEFTYFEN